MHTVGCLDDHPLTYTAANVCIAEALVVWADPLLPYQHGRECMFIANVVCGWSLTLALARSGTSQVKECVPTDIDGIFDIVE